MLQGVIKFADGSIAMMQCVYDMYEFQELSDNLTEVPPGSRIILIGQYFIIILINMYYIFFQVPIQNSM